MNRLMWDESSGFYRNLDDDDVYQKCKTIGFSWTLLAGMGNDGAHELKRMRDLGGITIAQNQESFVVFGMPKVAIELDAAKYILNPKEIVATLTALTTPKNKQE